MVKLLLVGYGRWGQKYIPALSEFANVSLTIANRDNWQDLINDGQDGVLICTPPQSHIEIADYSLSRGIPVMIEKPLSLSFKEANILSQYNNIPILVNHIHLFSKRYQEIKEEIVYYNIHKIWTTGFGPSPIRNYSELWDFGPHDISLVLDLIQDFPIGINCVKLTDRYYFIRLEFEYAISESYIGHSLYRDRYLNATYYNKPSSFEYDNKVHYPEDKPLTNALQVFINAIKGKDDYRLGLDLSLKVLQVLEGCQFALDNSYGIEVVQ